MIKETSSYGWFDYIVKLLTEAEMGYNTTIFWMFLTVFICGYLLLRSPKSRRIWVLIGSMVFYLWSGLGAFIIVLGTAVIVYAVTRKMDSIYADYDVEKEGLRPKEQLALFNTYKKKTQKYLWLAMFLVLSLWIYVKMAKLLNYETVESLMDVSIGLSIIVPLGISYYTLSTVGYLLDVYWRKIKVEYNFLNLFSAMIYFPHIVQGPISRYTDIIEQMKALPSANYKRVCHGLQLMLWGYIKKMVIADRLILFTATVFADPASFAGLEIIIAVALGVVQLYADFSGCMDIVRGISEVIGIKIDQNFRQPFFARSAQEFWSRWHITLGAWTKSYIYMPIAINPAFVKYTKKLKKGGKPWLSSFIKAFCPLIAVWTFTGLWHGTGIDYLMWGYYWCALMLLEKELKPLGDKLIEKLAIDTKALYFQAWQMLRTCIFFGAGRMITVVGVATGGLYLCKRIITEFRFWVLFDGSLFEHGLERQDFNVALVGMILMLIVDVLHERGWKLRDTVSAQILPVRWVIYYAAIIAFVIFGMYGPGFDSASFVYGAF